MVDSTTAVSTSTDRGEAVELRQQDREDQEDRGAEGLDQEGAGLLALLVLALQLEGDAVAEIGLGELRRDLLLHLGALHAVGDVGRHRHHALRR